MMTKKQSSKLRETLVNSKPNKPIQKTGGKEPAASTAPALSGGRQAGSGTSKTVFSCGRSNSLNSRGGDSTVNGTKTGGPLKTGSVSQQGCAGHQGARQAPRPARSALRLCSSRSFSSLHTSSLTAAPFMRSSRSLNRLDQRSTGDDSDAASSLQGKKGQTTVKKALSSGQLSSSDDQIRDPKGQCHGDDPVKMKTSSSSEQLEFPSTAECHHQCTAVKKQEKRSSLPRYLRLKSHACRDAEASAGSDPLNSKNGWMMRQNASGQWQQHWFVLTDQVLRFYKDSVAEEAADMDGEINLSTCFDITDYPTQKNSGFQIHTRDGVYTLCAMTSGMRRNWVQAVLKNVRPGLTPDISGSLSEPTTQLKSAQDRQSAEGPEKTEHLNSNKTSDCAEELLQQQKEQEMQPDGGQSSADRGCPSPMTSPPCRFSPSSSSAVSPVSSPQQMDEAEDVTDVSASTEGAGSDGSTCTKVVANDHCLEKLSNVQRGTDQQTGQLVKELEQTQKELSRLQQLNRHLQNELQQERDNQRITNPQNDLHSNSSSEQALASQRLQKMNHDLRIELEALKRSQEEARETELRRRVDLLAQQAQLLVTGDATALAQVHLEQDRLRFQEQRTEWERSMASLKSQLSASEEQRTEAESRFTQLQQELQNFHSLQQEAEHLQKHLQEMTAQLRANEEAQAQKEARLQKHLTLLQESQDRERRSLSTSLAQAEQRSQDLQERLDRAEEQVGSLSKTQAWTREIEKAQQQLSEELTCTVSAVQKLQEERDELNRRCQELQNQLCEADGEVSRLQSRLKTDETHYYNLEHSYERVCEDLQLALSRVQQKETETQDMREGYERLLDRKEQELSEVLLKMEVLGNSLEETEVKLNEVSKLCTCASSETSELVQQNSVDNSLPTVIDSRPKSIDNSQFLNNSSAAEYARTRTMESSYQSLVTAGDDPERFMSVIQTLETKLFITEEKLRDIMQRLEEHQSHISCQDPHLCSQLTRSRATAQHLSLLLHSQAKQSQRFAQETENRCRMLVGRFQVALNIIQACRERLQATPINLTDFEKQLATVVACLQQGEKEAERQQRESHNASKGEDKILNDETLTGMENQITALTSEEAEGCVAKRLMRELFVVEKMVSVLQSPHGISKLSSVLRKDEEDVALRYKSVISQLISLNTETRIHPGGAVCDNNEPFGTAIGRVCAEAELIYAAFKFQQQYESMGPVNNQRAEHLADVSPPELAPYDEPVPGEGRGMEGAAKQAEKDSCDVKEEIEKEPEWLERLLSRLQRRITNLRQLCHDISDASGEECVMDDNWGNAAGINWMLDQVKLIYLSDRLCLDFEQELLQSEASRDKLQALCKEQDVTIKDEQEAFNHSLCQLQEDNSVLREELERAEEKITSVESGNQRLVEDIRRVRDSHDERMRKLNTEFQEKIKELQQIHEEEMKHLHSYYTKSCVPKEKQTKTFAEAFTEKTGMERALSNRMEGGGTVAMMEAHQKDLERHEASCDKGVTAMEEMHRQVIGDLQQQHQKEVAALLKEKDQLLQEETSATMAAIVAMRRAHKQELERSRQSQLIKESADVTQVQAEYEKEMQSLQKELEVLSVQHTQKCLENAQLNQELHNEKQSLMHYRKENQELKQKQRETEEMTHAGPQLNDFYEMEVILRAREAEMQFLRQEARSLREELKIARMDKIYAQNKLQALYTNSREEPRHDGSKVREDFKFATWSPGRDALRQNHESAGTNTGNAAFLKKSEKSSLTSQIRGVRSKSLKEGLSVLERMKLFE